VFAIQGTQRQTNDCKGFQNSSMFYMALISSHTVMLLLEEVKLPCTLSRQLNILHTRASCPVTENTASCCAIEGRGSLQKGWQWGWWDAKDCVWRWSHVWAFHAWCVKVHQKVRSTCHVGYLQTNQANYKETVLHNGNNIHLGFTRTVSFLVFQRSFSE
jgi:hypothetical protein